MTKITEISILSLVLHSVSAYHGAIYGHYHDRDQGYYLPDGYNYDWPKRHIRKLRPSRNRIHRIGERYRMDTDSEDCECSCNDCVLPKLCCVPTCAACAVRTDVLYIPYPVPIIVTLPNNEPMNPSTTKFTRFTTKFTTKFTTMSPTVPRTESTTLRPRTPCTTYSPNTPTSPTTTSKLRPTIPSNVNQESKVTLPPGAQEVIDLYTEPNIARGEYDDNGIAMSTQPPRTSKKHCPVTPQCVYHSNKYQGLVPNRRSLYGRRKTSDWFSNIERSLRRTTRDWLPKYGIVSIPDHMARFFVEDIPQYDTNNIH